MENLPQANDKTRDALAAEIHAKPVRLDLVLVLPTLTGWRMTGTSTGTGRMAGFLRLSIRCRWVELRPPQGALPLVR